MAHAYKEFISGFLYPVTHTTILNKTFPYNIYNTGSRKTKETVPSLFPPDNTIEELQLSQNKVLQSNNCTVQYQHHRQNEHTVP